MTLSQCAVYGQATLFFSAFTVKLHYFGSDLMAKLYYFEFVFTIIELHRFQSWIAIYIGCSLWFHNVMYYYCASIYRCSTIVLPAPFYHCNGCGS